MISSTAACWRTTETKKSSTIRAPPQPLARWAAGDHTGDPQARGRRLGQRPHVDDVATPVGADQRGGRLVVEPEVAHVVVLDHEGAVSLGQLEHLAPPLLGEHGSVRVGVRGLEEDRPGAAALERLGQEIGADAVLVDRQRHRDEPISAHGRQCAQVGGRLNQHAGSPRQPSARKMVASADWLPT